MIPRYVLFLLVHASSASISKYSINRHLLLTATKVTIRTNFTCSSQLPSRKNPIAADDNTTVLSTGIMEYVLLEILSGRLNFTYSLL